MRSKKIICVLAFAATSLPVMATDVDLGYIAFDASRLQAEIQFRPAFDSGAEVFISLDTAYAGTVVSCSGTRTTEPLFICGGGSQLVRFVSFGLSPDEREWNSELVNDCPYGYIASGIPEVDICVETEE